MCKRLLPLLFLIIAASVTATPTTPCTSGSLTSYQGSFQYPATNGCSIGILDYSNFSYINDSNGPAASSIILTPSGQGFSFALSGNQPFVSTTGETVQFEIDYNILIDPAPVLTGADDSLDPPTGNVVVTEYFCNDSAYFSVGRCFGGTVQSLTVGTIAPYSTSAAIVFNPPATSFEEVGIVFTLTGASSFDALNASTTVVGAVPEPGSVILVGFALVAGSYTLKKRKR